MRWSELSDAALADVLAALAIAGQACGNQQAKDEFRRLYRAARREQRERAARQALLDRNLQLFEKD